ncbi:MAG TPA: YihY/virulence factor BrkB family protein, partial [Gaiellales bacterium]
LGLRPVRAVSAILHRYFGSRGPHLAAMLAYYALLSLFPFVFLSASLVSAIGRPEETSAFLRDLSHVLPATSAQDLARFVHSIESNAVQIGVIGGVGLLWSSLGFLSALESGLNVIYGLPNRGFLHQKLVVLGLFGTALIGLLAGLAVVVTSQTALSQIAPGLSDYAAWRIGGGLAISTLTTFAFLLLIYRTLPNTELRTRQVLPGALIGTVLLQLTFESLPLYVRSVSGLPALKIFGGALVLLVWLYLMGNVVLIGGAVTWWTARGRTAGVAAVAVAPIAAVASPAGATASVTPQSPQSP